jgi:predicted TIM-barrel fold metal-dependent hydrolase
MIGGLVSMGLGRAGAAPRGTEEVDTHAHVFLKDLPMANGRRYAPTYDASMDAYLEQLDTLGIARGVLVQPSFLGVDNSYLLRGIAQHAHRLRGVAVVEPSMAETELAALRRQGIAGVRLNLIGQATPDFRDPVQAAFLARLAKVGLFAEVQVEARRLAAVAEGILGAKVRLVVDHFGRPDAALGVDDPGFRYLLSLGPKGRTWVKLSGAYRLAPGQRGQDIATQAAALLVTHFGPERLMWGSDWPHTQFETVANYGTARESLDRWVPDAAVRRKLLVDTPSHLFGFNIMPLRKSA